MMLGQTRSYESPLEQVERSDEPAACDRSEPLSRTVAESLRSTGYFLTLDCRITIRVDLDGRVSLCGIVPSYFLKQKAQVAAMSVEGVESLRNDLIVLSAESILCKPRRTTNDTTNTD